MTEQLAKLPDPHELPLDLLLKEQPTLKLPISLDDHPELAKRAGLRRESVGPLTFPIITLADGREITLQHHHKVYLTGEQHAGDDLIAPYDVNGEVVGYLVIEDTYEAAEKIPLRSF